MTNTAANDPNFTASLDLEEDMKLTPPMNLVELVDWIAEMIEKTLSGLTTVRR